MGKAEEILNVVPSAPEKILNRPFFIHCQFSSPSIDLGSMRNKITNKKSPCPALKELKVYRGRCTLKGVMRITQWLKSGTKYWIRRKSSYNNLKPICDYMPGQQTGTIFFRAMLSHILSAPINIPNVTTSLMETIRYFASMNRESRNSSYKEWDTRKDRRHFLFTKTEIFTPHFYPKVMI